MTEKADHKKDFSLSRFDTVLKKHGYGFQYAVQNEISRVHHPRGGSPWYVETEEFPVESGNKGTRIDFILRNSKHNKSQIIVAECKRVNPKYSDWCFVKKPAYPTDRETNQVFCEQIQRSLDSYNPIQSRAIELTVANYIYSLGFEVKTKLAGDPWGKDPDAIETAATQVCRGLNGLINHYRQNPKLLLQQGSTDSPAGLSIIPTIFTTARLLEIETNLATASLSTGEIDISMAQYQVMDWIFYQYHQSPEIHHGAHVLDDVSNLKESLLRDFVRTIAIVSVPGIGGYLNLHAWKF